MWCGYWFLEICSLPWQGLKARTRLEKHNKIKEKKVSTSVEVIGTLICYPMLCRSNCAIILILVQCLYSLYAVDILLSLLLTSIIVVRLDLMKSQIMPIWGRISVIFSIVKVLTLLPFQLYMFLRNLFMDPFFFGFGSRRRFSVRSCIWLDNFEISGGWFCQTSISCSC